MNGMITKHGKRDESHAAEQRAKLTRIKARAEARRVTPEQQHIGQDSETILKTAHVAQTAAGDWQVFVRDASGALCVARLFFAENDGRSLVELRHAGGIVAVLEVTPDDALRLSYLEDAITNAHHGKDA